MKPSEVAKKYGHGIKVRNVQLWAANNGVSYTGEGMRKNYDFTDADIARFLNRKTTPGPKKEGK
jgi:DNA-binding transcriptional MerR regulator